MPSRRLWLIDLDNTLYDASWRVMGEINQRMTGFIAERLGLSWPQASALREHYWKQYGATLLGLVRHHGVCPHDFLYRTHPHAELPQFVRSIQGERARIRRLAGEKWLLTNSPRAYAQQVLDLIGLSRSFSRIVAMEDMYLCGHFRPKPSGLLMRKMVRASRRSPQDIVLIDDSNPNLKAAHRLGLRTARILASATVRQQARHSGRPLQARRPSYVRVQVNSLQVLIRQQYRLPAI